MTFHFSLLCQLLYQCHSASNVLLNSACFIILKCIFWHFFLTINIKLNFFSGRYPSAEGWLQNPAAAWLLNREKYPGSAGLKMAALTWPGDHRLMFCQYICHALQASCPHLCPGGLLTYLVPIHIAGLGKLMNCHWLLTFDWLEVHGQFSYTRQEQLGWKPRELFWVLNTDQIKN